MTRNNKNKTNRIHISFNSKDSKKVFFTGSEEDTKSKGTHKAAAGEENKIQKGKAEAVQDKDTDTSKQMWEAAAARTRFGSKRKRCNKKQHSSSCKRTLRSMNSSQRLEEQFSEVH